MKTGGLSVDALLRCRCMSASSCALLREDGGAKHTSNSTGDLITRFRDSMLYGSLPCAGGIKCAEAGIGPISIKMAGAEVAAKARQPKLAPSVTSVQVGGRISHGQLLEARGAPCAAQILATHETFAAIRARPFWADSHFVSCAQRPTLHIDALRTLAPVQLHPLSIHVPSMLYQPNHPSHISTYPI
jgi:hypothetical protein